MTDLEEKAMDYFYLCASMAGRAIPWEQLEETTKQLYRDRVLQQEQDLHDQRTRPT